VRVEASQTVAEPDAHAPEHALRLREYEAERFER
jgi:hypothetical protein